jgi:hypothetical protein
MVFADLQKQNIDRPLSPTVHWTVAFQLVCQKMALFTSAWSGSQSADKAKWSG